MSRTTSGEAEKWVHEKAPWGGKYRFAGVHTATVPMYQIDNFYRKMTFYPGMPIEGWSDD
jgi:hypothetical protein